MQTGVHIAPQVPDIQIRTFCKQLRLTPQAGSTQHRARRHLREGVVLVADKSIAHNSTLRNGGEAEAFRQLCGHILQAVDGQVDFAVQQRGFNFFGEQSLAADLGQGDVQNFIAFGDDLLQTDFTVRILFLQTAFDVIALPEGQQAFPSSNSYSFFHRQDYPRLCHLT